MTASPARIGTLDFIRGVAVLGILLLNIVNFGMPAAAYLNPRAFGGWHGIDLAAYCFNFVLFDGKMRGLFSFLFGASMLLVIDRAEAHGLSARSVHFRRMIVLVGFGIAHLALVWRGDILLHYALIGMIAFAFRRLAIPKLVRWAIGLIVVETLLMALVPLSVALMTAQAASGAEQLAAMANGFGVPSAQQLAGEIADHRGGYPAIVADRVHDNAFVPIGLLLQVGAETLAYMLLGMAGLRSGMLTGAWTPSRYRRWAAIGFGIGVPGYALLAADLVRRGFTMQAVALDSMLLTVPLRPAMILGWACLLVLVWQGGGAWTRRVAAAGRMAFTNYLLTSILCTTIFYGYGLGLFGQLSRAQLYIVVALVWAGILLWSQPWLARHRHGPFEWLWRTLAQGRVQPLRGAAPA